MPGTGSSKGAKARRSPSPDERKRDPDRTRERIIDAAVSAFSAHGFAGARVAEIAAMAGVNKQLIAYYFGGKDGLYQAVGRRWRAHEAQAYPPDLPLAEEVGLRILDAAQEYHASRLLAWAGLADTGLDDADAVERNMRLREEVAQIERRQARGEISRDLDPAALLLMLMAAANALAVYPHIARGVFGAANARDADVVRRYANEVAKVVGKLA